MHRVISVYGRKIFSVTLIFNALLTIACAVGILSGFYRYFPNWRPYTPYLINGNLFWIVIIAAILNIFPAASVGKVHTGRLWFHHYVYGFSVMILSSLWITFFTSTSLLMTFFISSTNIPINVGRFFFLGGLTLVLDDLPDVHRFTFKGLSWLKIKAHQAHRCINVAQLALGFFTLYVFTSVSLSVATTPAWFTPSNFVHMGTLLVTAITCFASVKGKVWQNLFPRDLH